MKEKKRYLLYEVSEEIALERARSIVYRKVIDVLGESGFSQAFVRVVEWNKNKGILCCTNEYLDRVIGALALVQSNEGKPFHLRLGKISGSISKLKPLLK